MSSIKLHGWIGSTNTQRVLVVSKELGIDLEWVEVDFRHREHKTEAWIENKHPFGQIPVLEDNGFFLFESRAIAQYLALKSKSKLLPNPSEGPQAYAKFLQAASIEVTDFDPWAVGIVIENFWKGAAGDKKRSDEFTAILDGRLDAYDRILSKQKFLAGDELSLADLYHLPLGSLLTNGVGSDLLTTSRRPNVARWWKAVSERASWKEVSEQIAAQ